MKQLLEIPLPVLLATIGAALIAAGVLEHWTIQGYSFSVGASEWRVISIVIGILFVFASLVLFSKGDLLGRMSRSASPTNADMALRTLDERPQDGLEGLLKNAKSIHIISRTSVNLFSQHQRLFERKSREDVNIEVLIVDPSSTSADLMYGGKPEVYSTNYRKVAQDLRSIKRVAGDKFVVKTTTHAPLFGMIIVQRDDAQNEIQVNLSGC